jgi:DNA-3-methyladenine glycosylase II
VDTPSVARRPRKPALPAAARAGLAHLAKSDPVFARVLREAGPLPWRVRTPGFPGLLHAIVGQQISNQAAAAIWGRVCALEGCAEPALFLMLDDEALRGAGLSRPKVVHARAVAQAFCDGVLATDALAAMSDDEAVAAISSVRGLGVWSAEIYLLFALQRQDVFPAGDLALQAAAADLKGLAARPSAKALREMAAAWQPHRAVAARLLWHWWRHLCGYPKA